MRTHSHTCFVYSLSRPLAAAGLLVVNPLEIFRLHCPVDASVLCLRVPGSFLSRIRWPGHCSCYLPDGSSGTDREDRLRTLLAETFQEYIEQKAGKGKTPSAKLPELLEVLKTDYSRMAPQPRASTMQRLGRILDRIGEQWNEEITLAAVAEEEYLSVSYLSRFFQKNLQMSFSQYLKELRLYHAAERLVRTNDSVTHISYDCGFHAPSSFIEVFKQQYGQTPGQYRQSKQENFRRQTDPKAQSDIRSDVGTLLSYVPETETRTQELRTAAVSVQTGQRLTHSVKPGRRILNIGYARDGLMAPVQQQILQAQQEIGFEYIRFHGLLDEDMHIYWEDKEGNPQFSFYYMDLLFDFLQTTGLKPFIELGFMPALLAREQTRIYDRPSVISGCTDLHRWEQLVQAVVLHLLKRYGSRQVRSWRFTTIALSYVHLNCLTMEEYQDLYRTTFRAVRAVDPKISFGGPGCFAERISYAQGIPYFLDFAGQEDCLPDFVTIQYYPHVHTYDSLFLDYTLNQQSAPAIVSEDTDFLKHTLEKLETLLKERGLEKLEICVEESNSTLWQRDLSSDTCYKAVWMAKNLAASYGRAVFGYWLLTDLLEERARIDSIFHGGYGLMTCNGIPKAGYYAMQLCSRLGDTAVACGENWLLTTDGVSYQLLVYNYSHYSNLYRHRYQRLKEPEKAYDVFEEGTAVHLKFTLEGLPAGTWRIERQKITRESGSSFDRWVELGSPSCVTQEEREYLISQSRPGRRIEQQTVHVSLYIDSKLNPQEMELLQFSPVEF